MARHPSVESVLLSGTITDAQTLELRRQLYSDNRISETEANWLFELNNTCREQERGWRIFFVEALTDFVVHQIKPEGYVSEENARWLVGQIDHDGALETATELELLLAIFEAAKSVPETLSAYTLDQVKQTVINGTGVTRSGKALETGVISEGDVEILRRILYAYGSGGNIGITAAEAEVLFDINDAAVGAANHPAWAVLFAQAIANHLMMASGHAPLARDTALRYEAFLYDEPEEQPESDGLVTNLVKSLRSIYSLAGDPGEKRAAKKRKKQENDSVTSEGITEDEAKWLASRINRDGNLSDAERAVLTFIKQESPGIDPALKPLLDLVA
jgi:hypothetical protein